MAKNYFSMKTGHESSDKYLKKQPIWFDSDLLYAFMLGLFSGAILILIITYL